MKKKGNWAWETNRMCLISLWFYDMYFKKQIAVLLYRRE